MNSLKNKLSDLAKYKKVDSSSHHGSSFTIDDLEDDEADQIEIIDLQKHGQTKASAQKASGENRSARESSETVEEDRGLVFSLWNVWNTLTFTWMQDLLKKGNEKPLTLDDLYDLPRSDSSEGVYRKFIRIWTQQIKENASPSLAWAFSMAFGKPFAAAGFLKLTHDSTLFVGPLLLNHLIKFLNDPSQPMSVGLWYVFGLFLANMAMSLCLRQYFWWCYRVGMNLRSSVITSVYSKALAISAAAISRKTTGEVTNLMSVDSTRLQELTPYLHAIWYSFFQIVVAMYFLWQQMGVSCLAGIAIIIVAIPITSRVSLYMKTLQRQLSKIRDERIKLSNEVLAGMKVIKLQAWEKEFQNRIIDVRNNELRVFRRYAISQSLSGTLAISIPLLVSIVTFITFVALGNELDVATALTSLALFEVLRFPLFMLPQVLNNIIEAKVSLDRIQDFLLLPERVPVASHPLKKPGVLMDRATVVWESTVRKLSPPNRKSCHSSKPTVLQQLLQPAKEAFAKGVHYVTCGKVELNTALATPKKDEAAALTDEEVELLIKDALLLDAENVIKELEQELESYRRYSDESNVDGGDANGRGQRFTDIPYDVNNRNVNSFVSMTSSASDTLGANDKGKAAEANSSTEDKRLLTLSRASLYAEKGHLVSIIGQVGSGKSSLLNSLLGNLRLCLGNVAVYGSIAYCSQLPFIQNSTLKDNILYGQPFDEEKYYQTLEMCALLPDLEVLPAGDATEIGERGINLSGGQKARVGLARAVYADADIYLLDDPLSAVDAHVGKHLFEKCIMRLKERNKCIIFVTNALQFVKYSSKIIILKDGHVAESGSFEHLVRRQGGLFADMMVALQETGAGNLSGQSSAGAKPYIIDDIQSEISSPVPNDSKLRKSRSSDVINASNSPSAKDSSKAKPPSINQQLGKLITTEDQEVGDVDYKVYLKWCTAAGGMAVGVFIIGAFFLGETISMMASWWLSYWSQHRDSGSPWFFLGIYIMINLIIIIAAFGREVFVRLRSLSASKQLFQELLTAVLYAPMSFYDTTPLGRIINRFSKDIYTVDEQIPYTVRAYIGTMARVTCVLLYICIITPLFIVGLLPLIIFYYMAQRYYIKTSRELTRIESTARSPIYALFSETLDGLPTIRAYQAERRLAHKNNHLLDQNQKAYYLNFSANCWLAVRLEFVGTLIVTFAALFAVLARESYLKDSSPANHMDNGGSSGGMDAARAAFAGLAGLSISFALNVTQSLNWTVRMASDLESQMVSVERVKSYTIMKQEAAHYLIDDPVTLHSSSGGNGHSTVANPMGSLSEINLNGKVWPQAGKVEVRNIFLRYRENLPLVLNNCSFSIQAGEKVGVVGRTGAGKSSLVTALLRLVELEGGEILIDNMNIRHIGLNTLRSVMAVIPQDPVLFSGTIRSNLDPFRRYNDLDLWDILKRTLLSEHVTSLDDVVNENGSNYSVGQRQLLCIARALLSKAKIIIMDEATAAVDLETDAAIQKTIRTEFVHATCITVAHRLNTIMDSDKVLVMDAGSVAEFDSPKQLLSTPESMFAALVANWENSHKDH